MEESRLWASVSWARRRSTASAISRVATAGFSRRSRLDAPDLVSRDRLADAVWGGDRPASWAKVLQNAVSRLRQALGSDAIGSGPGGYRLDVPSDDVDMQRFERLVELAERETTSDPLAAERHLHDARLLWRGRPFVDLEHWTDAARNRLSPGVAETCAR